MWLNNSKQCIMATETYYENTSDKNVTLLRFLYEDAGLTTEAQQFCFVSTGHSLSFLRLQIAMISKSPFIAMVNNFP